MSSRTPLRPQQQDEEQQSDASREQQGLKEQQQPPPPPRCSATGDCLQSNKSPLRASRLSDLAKRSPPGSPTRSPSPTRGPVCKVDISEYDPARFHELPWRFGNPGGTRWAAGLRVYESRSPLKCDSAASPPPPPRRRPPWSSPTPVDCPWSSPMRSDLLPDAAPSVCRDWQRTLRARSTEAEHARAGSPEASASGRSPLLQQRRRRSPSPPVPPGRGLFQHESPQRSAGSHRGTGVARWQEAAAEVGQDVETTELHALTSESDLHGEDGSYVGHGPVRADYERRRLEAGEGRQSWPGDIRQMLEHVKLQREQHRDEVKTVDATSDPATPSSPSRATVSFVESATAEGKGAVWAEFKRRRHADRQKRRKGVHQMLAEVKQRREGHGEAVMNRECSDVNDSFSEDASFASATGRSQTDVLSPAAAPGSARASQDSPGREDSSLWAEFQRRKNAERERRRGRKVGSVHQMLEEVKQKRKAQESSILLGGVACLDTLPEEQEPQPEPCNESMSSPRQLCRRSNRERRRSSPADTSVLEAATRASTEDLGYTQACVLEENTACGSKSKKNSDRTGKGGCSSDVAGDYDIQEATVSVPSLSGLPLSAEAAAMMKLPGVVEVIQSALVQLYQSSRTCSTSAEQGEVLENFRQQLTTAFSGLALSTPVDDTEGIAPSVTQIINDASNALRSDMKDSALNHSPAAESRAGNGVASRDATGMDCGASASSPLAAAAIALPDVARVISSALMESHMTAQRHHENQVSNGIAEQSTASQPGRVGGPSRPGGSVNPGGSDTPDRSGGSGTPCRSGGSITLGRPGESDATGRPGAPGRPGGSSSSSASGRLGEAGQPGRFYAVGTQGVESGEPGGPHALSRSGGTDVSDAPDRQSGSSTSGRQDRSGGFTPCTSRGSDKPGTSGESDSAGRPGGSGVYGGPGRSVVPGRPSASGMSVTSGQVNEAGAPGRSDADNAEQLSGLSSAAASLTSGSEVRDVEDSAVILWKGDDSNTGAFGAAQAALQAGPDGAHESRRPDVPQWLGRRGPGGPSRSEGPGEPCGPEQQDAPTTYYADGANSLPVQLRAATTLGSQSREANHGPQVCGVSLTNDEASGNNASGASVKEFHVAATRVGGSAAPGRPIGSGRPGASSGSDEPHTPGRSNADALEQPLQQAAGTSWSDASNKIDACNKATGVTIAAFHGLPDGPDNSGRLGASSALGWPRGSAGARNGSGGPQEQEVLCKFESDADWTDRSLPQLPPAAIPTPDSEFSGTDIIEEGVVVVPTNSEAQSSSASGAAQAAPDVTAGSSRGSGKPGTLSGTSVMGGPSRGREDEVCMSEGSDADGIGNSLMQMGAAACTRPSSGGSDTAGRPGESGAIGIALGSGVQGRAGGSGLQCGAFGSGSPSKLSRSGAPGRPDTSSTAGDSVKQFIEQVPAAASDTSSRESADEHSMLTHEEVPGTRSSEEVACNVASCTQSESFGHVATCKPHEIGQPDKPGAPVRSAEYVAEQMFADQWPVHLQADPMVEDHDGTLEVNYKARCDSTEHGVTGAASDVMPGSASFSGKPVRPSESSGRVALSATHNAGGPEAPGAQIRSDQDGADQASVLPPATASAAMGSETGEDDDMVEDSSNRASGAARVSFPAASTINSKGRLTIHAGSPAQSLDSAALMEEEWGTGWQSASASLLEDENVASAGAREGAGQGGAASGDQSTPLPAEWTQRTKLARTLCFEEAADQEFDDSTAACPAGVPVLSIATPRDPGIAEAHYIGSPANSEEPQEDSSPYDKFRAKMQARRRLVSDQFARDSSKGEDRPDAPSGDLQAGSEGAASPPAKERIEGDPSLQVTLTDCQTRLRHSPIDSDGLPHADYPVAAVTDATGGASQLEAQCSVQQSNGTSDRAAALPLAQDSAQKANSLSGRRPAALAVGSAIPADGSEPGTGLGNSWHYSQYSLLDTDSRTASLDPGSPVSFAATSLASARSCRSGRSLKDPWQCTVATAESRATSLDLGASVTSEPEAAKPRLCRAQSSSSLRIPSSSSLNDLPEVRVSSCSQPGMELFSGCSESAEVQDVLSAEFSESGIVSKSGCRDCGDAVVECSHRMASRANDLLCCAGKSESSNASLRSGSGSGPHLRNDLRRRSTPRSPAQVSQQNACLSLSEARRELVARSATKVGPSSGIENSYSRGVREAPKLPLQPRRGISLEEFDAGLHSVDCAQSLRSDAVADAEEHGVEELGEQTPAERLTAAFASTMREADAMEEGGSLMNAVTDAQGSISPMKHRTSTLASRIREISSARKKERGNSLCSPDGKTRGTYVQSPDAKVMHKDTANRGSGSKPATPFGKSSHTGSPSKHRSRQRSNPFASASNSSSSPSKQERGRDLQSPDGTQRRRDRESCDPRSPDSWQSTGTGRFGVSNEMTPQSGGRFGVSNQMTPQSGRASGTWSPEQFSAGGEIRAEGAEPRQRNEIRDASEIKEFDDHRGKLQVLVDRGSGHQTGAGLGRTGVAGGSQMQSTGRSTTKQQTLHSGGGVAVADAVEQLPEALPTAVSAAITDILREATEMEQEEFLKLHSISAAGSSPAKQASMLKSPDDQSSTRDGQEATKLKSSGSRGSTNFSLGSLMAPSESVRRDEHEAGATVSFDIQQSAAERTWTSEHAHDASGVSGKGAGIVVDGPTPWQIGGASESDDGPFSAQEGSAQHVTALQSGAAGGPGRPDKSDRSSQLIRSGALGISQEPETPRGYGANGVHQSPLQSPEVSVALGSEFSETNEIVEDGSSLLGNREGCSNKAFGAATSPFTGTSTVRRKGRLIMHASSPARSLDYVVDRIEQEGSGVHSTSLAFLEDVDDVALGDSIGSSEDVGAPSSDRMGAFRDGDKMVQSERVLCNSTGDGLATEGAELTGASNISSAGRNEAEGGDKHSLSDAPSKLGDEEDRLDSTDTLHSMRVELSGSGDSMPLDHTAAGCRQDLEKPPAAGTAIASAAFSSTWGEADERFESVPSMLTSNSIEGTSGTAASGSLDAKARSNMLDGAAGREGERDEPVPPHSRQGAIADREGERNDSTSPERRSRTVVFSRGGAIFALDGTEPGKDAAIAPVAWNGAVGTAFNTLEGGFMVISTGAGAALAAASGSASGTGSSTAGKEEVDTCESKLPNRQLSLPAAFLECRSMNDVASCDVRSGSGKGKGSGRGKGKVAAKDRGNAELGASGLSNKRHIDFEVSPIAAVSELSPSPVFFSNGDGESGTRRDTFNLGGKDTAAPADQADVKESTKSETGGKVAGSAAGDATKSPRAKRTDLQPESPLAASSEGKDMNLSPLAQSILHATLSASEPNFKGYAEFMTGDGSGNGSSKLPKSSTACATDDDISPQTPGAEFAIKAPAMQRQRSGDSDAAHTGASSVDLRRNCSDQSASMSLQSASPAATDAGSSGTDVHTFEDEEIQELTQVLSAAGISNSALSGFGKAPSVMFGNGSGSMFGSGSASFDLGKGYGKGKGMSLLAMMPPPMFRGNTDASDAKTSPTVSEPIKPPTPGNADVKASSCNGKAGGIALPPAGEGNGAEKKPLLMLTAPPPPKEPEKKEPEKKPEEETPKSPAKAKGKGKAPPPPKAKEEPAKEEKGKGKGKGKAPAPKPKPPAADGKAKGKGKGKDEKKEHKISKLKPLGWQKIQAEEGSLWASAANGGMEFPRSLIEAVFPWGSTTVKQKKGTAPEEAAKSLTAPARCMGICIGLHPVRNLTLQILHNALLALDDTILTPEVTESLLMVDPKSRRPIVLPTPEEIAAAKEYVESKEPIDVLDDASKYLVAVHDVPHLHDRLLLQQFRSGFDKRVLHLRRQLEIITDALRQVQGSERFHSILITVLKMGNVLNDGTARGDAAGFRITSLAQLSQLKQVESKQQVEGPAAIPEQSLSSKPRPSVGVAGLSLLDLLVQLMEEQKPELLCVEEDMPRVRPSARVDLSEVEQDMKLLRNDLSRISRSSGSAASSPNSANAAGSADSSGNSAQAVKGDMFPTFGPAFVSSAEGQLANLDDALKESRQVYADVLAFFGEKPGTGGSDNLPPHEWLGFVGGFLTELERSINGHRSRTEKIQRKARRSMGGLRRAKTFCVTDQGDSVEKAVAESEADGKEQEARARSNTVVVQDSLLSIPQLSPSPSESSCPTTPRQRTTRAPEASATSPSHVVAKKRVSTKRLQDAGFTDSELRPRRNSAPGLAAGHSFTSSVASDSEALHSEVDESFAGPLNGSSFLHAEASE